MFFAILLALIAIGAGYYIHKQFSPAAATHEVSIPDESKHKKLAASKRDVPDAVSNRSVTDTAVTKPSLRSAVGGTQIGEKSKTEPQRDESSRDVKTARSPSVTEIPSHVSVADATSTVDAKNKDILVKDSEGGLGADHLSKQPNSKTPIAPEPEPSLRSAVGGTETQIGEKSKTEPQRDDSSRDVKTARTPTSAENMLHAAAPTSDANNKGIVVKDSEGIVGADPLSKPPTSKTPIPIAVFEIGNLPDSTARNSSSNPGASNQEVKPDSASTNALSEKSAIGGTTETQKGTGEKFNTEQPQRDESSRDVETARSPSVAETPSAIASAAPTADVNNNGILTKDSEGGLSADPVPKSPVIPIKVFEIGNLPDSAAGNASPNPGPSDSAANNSSPNPGPSDSAASNSSPNPGASNQEVKPDLATAIDLSEKKKAKKSGKKSKKAKKSSKKDKKDKKEKKAKKSKKEKKSKEIKSADGASD